MADRDALNEPDGSGDHDELSTRRFHREAAKLLDERRPDRYVVSDGVDEENVEVGDDPPDGSSSGMEWLDVAAEQLADLLPEHGVKKLYARQILGRMESDALRRGNRQVRTYYLDGQPQLGWLETAGYPVQVVQRITKVGERVRVRRERVRIAAMTSADWRLFAAEERKNAARDFASRNESCIAAEWIADELDGAGASTLADWVRSAAA